MAWLRYPMRAPNRRETTWCPNAIFTMSEQFVANLAAT